MTQVYNYLFGRNPRVAIQPADLGKTSGIFFFYDSLSRQGLFIREKKKEREKGIECVFIDITTTSIL